MPIPAKAGQFCTPLNNRLSRVGTSAPPGQAVRSINAAWPRNGHSADIRQLSARVGGRIGDHARRAGEKLRPRSRACGPAGNRRSRAKRSRSSRSAPSRPASRPLIAHAPVLACAVVVPANDWNNEMQHRKTGKSLKLQAGSVGSPDRKLEARKLRLQKI